MKPVAWYIENNYYESLEEAQFFCNNKAQLEEQVTPLYTADQLRQAKVEVLRKAAERVNAADGSSTYLVRGQLNRMADEIERSKA